MKCFKCGRSPFAHSVTLTRQNQPGELPAVWACSVHDKTPAADPLLAEVVQALHQAAEPHPLRNDPHVTRACEEEIAARTAMKADLGSDCVTAESRALPDGGQT